MHDQDIDLALYGGWGEDGYRGSAKPAARTARVANEILLEVKSAEAAASGEDLREILSGVTEELKEQLHLFRRLRREASDRLDDPDGDHKLARADLKAATDAVSLIIRTLDKTDELQRKLDDERIAAEDRAVDPQRLDALCADLNRHIETRAGDIARDRVGSADAPGEPPPDDAPG